MGILAIGRKSIEAGESFQLREPEVSYHIDLGIENEDIGVENSSFWNNNLNISI